MPLEHPLRGGGVRSALARFEATHYFARLYLPVALSFVSLHGKHSTYCNSDAMDCNKKF
jgi:hypothetical protein